jgi:hypothetical protein
LFISLGLHYSVHSGNMIRKQRGIYYYYYYYYYYLSAFAKLQNVTISFVMFACLYIHPSTRKYLAPTGWILVVFDIGGYFENLSRKFKFYYNQARTAGTLHEHQYTFFFNHISLISSWNKKCFRKTVAGKIKTHILCSVTLFFFSSKIIPFMRYCEKILQSGAGHRWQYETCPLHAGYLRLQPHTKYMQNSLFFRCNNGCTNMPQCPVIHTLPVLLHVHGIFNKHGPQFG